MEETKFVTSAFLFLYHFDSDVPPAFVLLSEHLQFKAKLCDCTRRKEMEPKAVLL